MSTGRGDAIGSSKEELFNRGCGVADEGLRKFDVENVADMRSICCEGRDLFCAKRKKKVRC